MRAKKHIYLLIGLLAAPVAEAQTTKNNILPDGFQRAQVVNGDTLPVVNLREIFVFPDVKFKNKRQQKQYDKLVRDVKRTLPYAKLIYDTLIETYEYIETLPTEKEQRAHIKRMEKELFEQYKPELKRLTFSQGKLLIKLIDRECNQSAFNLAKAFLGPFRAGFWNLFAGMFGASLKSESAPQGKPHRRSEWSFSSRTAYSESCLKKSHITMPVVTATFSECFVPY